MTQQTNCAPGSNPRPAIPPSGEILCPMCDYDLRGTTEPRCPECGFRFDWEELLDPTRRRHPYLYEHRIRDSFAAFWQTLANGLLPWRFWKTLHPAQPSDPRKLRQYFLWCMLPLLLAAGVVLALQVMNYTRSVQTYRAGVIARLSTPGYKETVVSTFGSVQAYLAKIDRDSPPVLSWQYLAGRSGRAIRQTLFWFIAPLLQFATLMIFLASMRKARVKVIHVWRCVVYCWDPIFILGVVFCVLAALLLGRGIVTPGPWPFPPGRGILRYPGEFFIVFQWGMIVLLLVAGLKLAAAYRLYLRFDRPELTILATQIILLLLITTLAALGVI